MPLSDSSQTYMRAVWPKPSPAVLRLQTCCRRPRGLPVLVHEVSRRAWGLRLRRTEQELALSRLFMLPSVHYKDVCVAVCFLDDFVLIVRHFHPHFREVEIASTILMHIYTLR